MKNLKLSLIAMFFAFISVCQTAKSQTEDVPPWNKGTLKMQLDYLINKSPQGGDYRSVKQNWLFIVRSRVLDSMKIAKQEILDNKRLVTIKNAKVDSLQTILNGLSQNLSKVSNEKESIAFLGIQMKKHSYNTFVWSIVGILAASLLVFIFLFKRSNSITVQIRNDHNELKEEFEAFRKRSLQREEEMARKHLYEINKYKK